MTDPRDLEALRQEGLYDARWSHPRQAFVLEVSAAQVIRPLLTHIAHELAGPNATQVREALSLLAWHALDEGRVETAYEDVIDALGWDADATALIGLRGTTPEILHEILHDEVPHAVTDARINIVRNRRRAERETADA